ncbi:MAG: lambda exonuclease family protein [Pseudomonadota bacterium]
MSHQREDAEWWGARCGKVTGSRISVILGKGRGSDWSATATAYASHLVAERLRGECLTGAETFAMRQGIEREPEARASYERMTGESVELVGFVPHPRIPMAGASPDGLVGDDCGVEFKCPGEQAHAVFIDQRAPSPEYLAQVQWCMACTGRGFWDLAFYCPEFGHPLLSLVIHTIVRDQEMIETMEERARSFLKMVEEREAALRAEFSLEEDAAA